MCDEAQQFVDKLEFGEAGPSGKGEAEAQSSDSGATGGATADAPGGGGGASEGAQAFVSPLQRKRWLSVKARKPLGR